MSTDYSQNPQQNVGLSHIFVFDCFELASRIANGERSPGDAVLLGKRRRPRWLSEQATAIDDSTPVSQSRHTLRFQPIACCSIMRCPRVLTRPEMVWQAFVPDTASSQLAVFDSPAEKNFKKKLKIKNTPGKRNCCYSQCKSDARYPVKSVQVSHSSRFRSQKQGWKL